jgi:hypothetical protein
MRGAANWVAGSLGAVATVMLAGIQLSSIGQLSFETQPGRLIAAALGLAIGVGAVLAAIYLLSRAQLPVESNIDALENAASNSSSTLRKAAEANMFFTRGRPNLAQLLADFREARKQFDESRVAFALADEAVFEAEISDLPAAKAARSRAATRVELKEARLDDLLIGIRALYELNAYLGVKEKLQRVLPLVLVMAVVAAISFVIFAWAANPPTLTDPGAALDARPSFATVRLGQDDLADFVSRLGAECADAATAPGGIQVIAIESSDSDVTVVTMPSAACPAPVRLTLNAEYVVPANGVFPR